MVIWKSDRSSSRNPSNSSSARSISSMSSTGGLSRLASIACSSGRFIRKSSVNSSFDIASRSTCPAASSTRISSSCRA